MKRKSSLFWETIVPWFLIGCAVALGVNVFPQAIQFIQQRWAEDTQQSFEPEPTGSPTTATGGTGTRFVPKDRPPVESANQ